MKPIQILAAVTTLGSVLIASAEVPTTITYQGRVQVSGTNFIGAGQFKFALVDAGSNATRQATAVATVTSGFITAIAVIDGGAGYSNPPTVTITDATGSGATATASVSGGAVAGFTVQLTGSGYSANPVVTVALPPPNLIYVTHWSNDGSSAAGGEPSAAVSLPVTQGLFTTLLGDATLANMTPIPTDALNHRDVRLRIWFNDGANGFAALSPDQPLTSAPYALHALNASTITGPVPASLLAGTIAPANLADGGIDASKLAANSVTSAKIADGSIVATDLNLNLLEMTFWRLGGNTGTTPGPNFLGSTDNQPLEFKVNGQRILRLENNGDGSDPDALPDGAPNVLGGSHGNYISPSTVGATIAGGGATNYNGSGRTNSVQADYGTVGGGLGNNVLSFSLASTIAGGTFNRIGTNAQNAVIGGGYQNNIAASSSSTIIAGGQLNDIGALSFTSVIGGGNDNNIAAGSQNATIAGGAINDIGTNTYGGFIGGGNNNNIAANASYATIAGGADNDIAAGSTFSIVGGGEQNNIGANSMNGTIAGGHANDIGTNSSSGTIGGGYDNNIAANSMYATIAGGYFNDIRTGSSYSTVGGGNNNNIAANSTNATIAGGDVNDIGTNSSRSTISGGEDNTIEANSAYSVIAGGFVNSIRTNSNYSAIGGGDSNIIMPNSQYAVIPGGQRNIAANHAFAAGTRANAIHTGAFVWADSQNADFASSANNQFLVRASGNVGINTNNPTSTLQVAGTIAASALRAPGAGINTGTFAFTHRAAAGNTTGAITTIDNALCNGDSNAILVVTHNYDKDTSALRLHPQVVGVLYTAPNWVIFHEDNTTLMQVGDAFNVMVIKP